jgi:hypothetical protein
MGEIKGTENRLSYLRMVSITFLIHNRHHQNIMDIQYER